jgi:hypothetical protein
MGLPAGMPVNVWLETRKMEHDDDMKKTDIIREERREERDREDRNNLVNKAVGILGPAIPGLLNAFQGQTTPEQQDQLFQLLSQKLTPEERQNLAESIVAKSRTVQPPLESSEPQAGNDEMAVEEVDAAGGVGEKEKMQMSSNAQDVKPQLDILQERGSLSVSVAVKSIEWILCAKNVEQTLFIA